MFGFDEAQDAHQEVYNRDGGYEREQGGGPEYKAKFTHELIGGAAAFEGMKQWEDHQRKEGKPVSHQFAKELLAGFVGGEVDKLAETKGREEWDEVEARRHANETANNMYDQHYIRGQGADQYDPNQYDRPQHFEGDRRERREERREERYEERRDDRY